MTRAQQIAGYLKLSAAHFTSTATDKGGILSLREKLSEEMDSDTLCLAQDIKRAMGGWYDGDKNYSHARELEAAHASVR